jgi:hypothetical protein
MLSYYVNFDNGTASNSTYAHSTVRLILMNRRAQGITTARNVRADSTHWPRGPRRESEASRLLELRV